MSTWRTRSRFFRRRVAIYAKEQSIRCEELSTGNVFDLEIIDISKDQTFFERYFLKIPVVWLDGEEVFEAEQIATPDDCKKNLANLVRELVLASERLESAPNFFYPRDSAN